MLITNVINKSNVCEVAKLATTHAKLLLQCISTPARINQIIFLVIRILEALQGPATMTT